VNLAYAAIRLAGLLSNSDLVFLADDEQQAKALAAALGGLRPDASILFLSSSDALPGDTAPASPANTGQRVAALRSLRLAQQQLERPRIALILSG
jgi:transcription-repair coupling factor (superfamily II helicase)